MSFSKGPTDPLSPHPTTDNANSGEASSCAFARNSSTFFKFHAKSSTFPSLAELVGGFNPFEKY